MSGDANDFEVRRMLHTVVCSLVDDVDKIELIHSASPEGMSFQIRSAPSDVGKLIGKSGRTARAIRTILSAASARNGRRYTLDIVQQPTLPADFGTGSARGMVFNP